MVLKSVFIGFFALKAGSESANDTRLTPSYDGYNAHHRQFRGVPRQRKLMFGHGFSHYSDPETHRFPAATLAPPLPVQGQGTGTRAPSSTGTTAPSETRTINAQPRIVGAGTSFEPTPWDISGVWMWNIHHDTLEP